MIEYVGVSEEERMTDEENWGQGGTKEIMENVTIPYDSPFNLNFRLAAERP